MFSIRMSNWPSTIYWKNCAFLTAHQNHLCYKSYAHIFGQWIWFWVLSVPVVYWSSLKPTPHYLNYCRFVISHTDNKFYHFSSFLQDCLEDCLGYSGSLNFQINFRVNFSIHTNIHILLEFRDYIKPIDQFGKNWHILWYSA